MSRSTEIKRDPANPAVDSSGKKKLPRGQTVKHSTSAKTAEKPTASNNKSSAADAKTLSEKVKKQEAKKSEKAVDMSDTIKKDNKKKSVKSASNKATNKAATKMVDNKSVDDASAKKNSGKSRNKNQSNSEPSSKTPQVMKLVQPSEMINPVIIAGKSSIPKALRGVEPLSRMLRREAREVLGSELSDELVTVNLTALAIDESAAEILRRFNACDCHVCVETLSTLTAEQVTARFVKVKQYEAESGSQNLDELKKPVKKQVMQQMIRIVIHNTKRSFHG